MDANSLRFLDFETVFIIDDKHLMFLSVRGFGSVYDAHVFELSLCPSGGCS